MRRRPRRARCAFAGSSREGYEVRLSSVPATAAEAAEEEAEDDQDDPDDPVPDEAENDPEDDEDCSYTHYLSPLALEIAPQGLLAFDRLEQCLEIAFSKPARAVALDDLEEERRPILRGLREDLKQVPLLVAVGEDAQATKVLVVHVDLAHAILQVVVVRGRSPEEPQPALLEPLHRANDVVRGHCHVLHSRPAVEVEVLLDLALPLALGGLVDRELDLALPVHHDLRHQRRVLGRDRLVREVDQLGHAE